MIKPASTSATNSLVASRHNQKVSKQLIDGATYFQFTEINKSYAKKSLGLKKIFSPRKVAPKQILMDAKLELLGGECVLLTGKNGSGKSTLLRILSGLLKPDSMTINTGHSSKPWKQARKLIRHQVMYLYQEPYMFDGSVKRNLEYALQGPKIASLSSSFSQSKTESQIKEVLKLANLEHRTDTSAKCLSGGERQRVALAQAWLKQPSVLLLDEPTANMDAESRVSTEKLLCKFKSAGIALLIASHDVNHFRHTMDKRLLLEDGKIHDISNSIPDENNTKTKSDKVTDNAGNHSSIVSLFPEKRINT